MKSNLVAQTGNHGERGKCISPGGSPHLSRSIRSQSSQVRKPTVITGKLVVPLRGKVVDRERTSAGRKKAKERDRQLPVTDVSPKTGESIRSEIGCSWKVLLLQGDGPAGTKVEKVLGKVREHSGACAAKAVDVTHGRNVVHP